jgi:hypothetical protein
MPTSLVGIWRTAQIVSGNPLRPTGASGGRFHQRLPWEIGMRTSMRHSLEALTPFIMLTGVFVIGLAVSAVLAKIVGAIVLYILHAF